MKFSQKPRTTFEVPQYNPGPGYYINQDKQEQELKGQHNNVNLQSFGRQDRFYEANNHGENKIGPGAYKYEKSDFDKFNLNKATLREKSEKTHDKTQFVRINAVPSIPSKNVKEGYQEIGDGLLIVMKNQKEGDNVGPGQYNPNYNFVKPRIQKPFIPTQLKQRQTSSDNLEKKQKANLNVSQQSDIASIVEQHLVGLVPKDQNSIQERIVNEQLRPVSDQRVRQPHGQRFRSELTCLVSRDPKKRQIGEYNLELLMIRERQLAKDDVGPPPGKYYNQNQHTSFKVPFKPPEFQCFDSSSQRFEENGIFKNKLGPGQYNVANITSVSGVVQTAAVKFGKEKRSTSDYESLRSKQPGPGEYALKANEDIGNLERYDLYKLKQANLKFNSVFGSGARRFTDQKPQSDNAPGPGSYTISDNSKVKKRRRGKTLYMQSNSEATLLTNSFHNKNNHNDNSLIINQQHILPDRVKLNSNNISYNEQNTTNYTRIVEIDDTSFIDVRNAAQNQNHQKNQKPEQSYVFKSQTNRFNAHNQSFDNKYNLDGADKLGPGCYEITQDIHKQKPTHNKGRDLLNKSLRVTDKMEGIQIPKLGPGYYDPNVQTVKPKVACITKI